LFPRREVQRSRVRQSPTKARLNLFSFGLSFDFPISNFRFPISFVWYMQCSLTRVN
jgi:hypothetical protein